MKIPFLDLKRQLGGDVRRDIDSAITEVIDSGHLIGGEFVERFERKFADYCGADYAIGTGNGLDALYLALLSLDIGPGDQVIVPAHTFVATWLAVSRTGAEPVPVDVRRETGNIDERLIERAVSEKTRAIIVVHLYGFIPNMNSIISIAERYGLKVVEDAAQGHGAKYDGRMAGAMGTLAAFSFYPTKNLGALGDGGMVTTSDHKLAEKVGALRDYGRTGRNEYTYKGINSRLDPLQANILHAKLQSLDRMNGKRKSIARRYDQTLTELGQLGQLGQLGLYPLISESQESVWHQYVVVVEDRSDFIAALAADGVGTDVHYPIPPFRQPCYREEMSDHSRWPVASELAEKVVSLPIGDYLLDAEVDYICSSLKRFAANR